MVLDSAEKPESQFLEGSGIPRDDPGPSGDDERGFRCRFCAKAFHRKEHLQRHERLRELVPPYEFHGDLIES